MPRRLEHGTPEGYARGCIRGDTCPALAVHGMSCETAHTRHASSERRYMALYDRGLTSTQIAQRLGFTPRPIREELPTPPVPAPSRPPRPVTRTQQIRAWARQHGLHVPAGGPMPKLLQTAFDADDPALAIPPLREDHPMTDQPTTTPPTGPGDEPAQPLAERSHDPSTPTAGQARPAAVDDAPGAAADAPGTGPAEGEGMGHLTLATLTRGLTQSARAAKGREIRAWLRSHGHPGLSDKGIIPSTALAEWAAAHEDPAPLDTAHRSDLLDETRTRIDTPTATEPPAEHRPEWATVTISQDVEAARNETLEALALAELHQRQTERARTIAVHLEQALSESEHRNEVALALALQRWANEQARAAALDAELHDAHTRLARSLLRIVDLSVECHALLIENTELRGRVTAQTADLDRARTPWWKRAAS